MSVFQIDIKLSEFKEIFERDSKLEIDLSKMAIASKDNELYVTTVDESILEELSRLFRLNTVNYGLKIIPNRSWIVEGKVALLD